MKIYIALFSILMLLAGCGKCPVQKSPVLAKVDNYEITLPEFNEELKSVGLSGASAGGKKEFLGHLINRKLILQDAQRRELDKDPAFLKMIERFWEQSLLKLALEKKAREISNFAAVSDQSVEEAYRRMAREGKAAKPYEEMRGQIRFEILRLKEAQAMNNWFEQLRKKAKVEADYKLLGGQNE